MKSLDLGEKINDKIVLCLGYFDLIHKGHVDLIEKANKVAKNKNAKLAIFTFKNDLSNLCFKKPSAYSFDRRLELYNKLGIEYVISTEMNEEFKNTEYKDFLKYIFNTYKIVGIATGEEYRFGKNREGVIDSNTVDNVEHVTTLVHMDDGTILSSSIIKEMLSNGKVYEANKYLYEPYKIFVRRKKIEGNIILADGEYICECNGKILKCKKHSDVLELNEPSEYGIEVAILNEVVEV